MYDVMHTLEFLELLYQHLSRLSSYKKKTLYFIIMISHHARGDYVWMGIDFF